MDIKAVNARGKELANDHWSYVEAILIAHGQPDDLISMVGFHYKTALQHGYKHGVEEAGNHYYEGSETLPA